MRCGLGWTAGQCIADHYERVQVLEVSKSGTGPHWRGRCPTGSIRAWLRGHVACLMGAAGNAHEHCVSPALLTDLALSGMPPTSLRLGLLELAGMDTAEALDKLGVARQNRYRVVSALRQSRRKDGT